MTFRINLTGIQKFSSYGATAGDGMSLNKSSIYSWFNSGYNLSDSETEMPALALVKFEGSFVSDNRILGIRLIRRTGFSSFQYHQVTYRTRKNGSTSTFHGSLSSTNRYNGWLNGPGSSYSGNLNALTSNTGETFHGHIWVKTHKKNLTSTQAASDVVAFSQMISYDTAGTPQFTEAVIRSRGTSGGNKIVSGIQLFSNSGNINGRLEVYNIGSRLEN